ncbi:SH3 domain-containing protein [Polaribacter sp.]|uniref:SH3 domain-containing protein n=1 Tax=Polaribacter sp. TaxID=1920175 RepID=UPI003F6CEFA7
MKKLIVILILSFLNQVSLSQEIVIAGNGLNVRKKPNLTSEKIGKLHFGSQVKIIEKTGILLEIKDDNQIIKGQWVKIEFENLQMLGSEHKSGYVFNGYVKNEKEFNLYLEKEILKFEKFQHYKIHLKSSPYFIKGDFFGDGISDYAIKVSKEKDNVEIIILDIGGKNTQLLKPIENYKLKDNENRIIDEFGWAEIFEKVKSGTILWSNFTDDFRSLEEVPNSEKVLLNYEAIYVHASESCGGGFIFWKDGIFNWLQQE